MLRCAGCAGCCAAVAHHKESVWECAMRGGGGGGARPGGEHDSGVVLAFRPRGRAVGRAGAASACTRNKRCRGVRGGAVSRSVEGWRGLLCGRGRGRRCHAGEEGGLKGGEREGTCRCSGLCPHIAAALTIRVW